MEFVQNELTALRERAENRRKVTKINRLSTEEQLNARRKGISHKSKVKVKSADVAKENREKRERAEGARKKLADMKIGEKGEDPEKYGELLDQLDHDHEGIDEYILSAEESYNRMKMMVSMAQKHPGTKKEGPATMLRMLGPTFERECPKFHDEYWRTFGIPEGLDKEWARKVLYRAYLDARRLPWFNLLTWRLLEDGDKGAGRSREVLEKGVITDKHQRPLEEMARRGPHRRDLVRQRPLWQSR